VELFDAFKYSYLKVNTPLYITEYEELKVKPNIPAISPLVKEPLVTTGYEMMDPSRGLDGVTNRNIPVPFGI
jgi:hypothetical protein